ncbi:TetR/AcrR family transcriptional regulator [Nocardia mangyaensis]|uniref:TetR/AcrR family transcriptional regulator n=1 Tax=Nocardia mangyaensis TaxID=2213200 RepID=UPI002676A357|nr:TetR/AcrR family transcriptional regulator [Nocardia mangyaensis]MDO3649012.1 TetR/AcrR family transcriptional regulator [Nocardia mangyaensis]
MADRGRPRGFDRELALRRAMEVFWERGYDSASMTDLTTAMGINSPSLYAAFGDKEALFRAAVDLYCRTDGGHTARALREESTAYAAIEAMLRDNVTAYTDPGLPSGCMVVLAGATYATRTAPIREFLVEARRETGEDIRARLERGVTEGDLAPDTDTAALAAFYSTVLYGLSIQARDGVGHAELSAAVDSALRVLAAAAS